MAQLPGGQVSTLEVFHFELSGLNKSEETNALEKRGASYAM